MEKSPNQEEQLGDPEMAGMLDGLMSDWKEGKLSYEEALRIYTAKALQKAIERTDNKQ